MKLSANLGFLWTELPLLDAIRAAKAAGFDAVELHWPYHVPTKDLRAVLDEVRLPLISLNTDRGDVSIGENGLAAVVGRQDQARNSITQAIDYAVVSGARAVHVMARNAFGPEAHRCFCENLDFACDLAKPHNVGILIEPLNGFDAPGYFLNSLDQAYDIVHHLSRDNLRIMFDCYHAGRSGENVENRLIDMLPMIGHIQIASVPDRGPPDVGDLDYRSLFKVLKSVGWDKPLGAEYRPIGATDASLTWMDHIQRS